MAASTSPRTRPSAPALVLLVRHGTTATTGRVLPGRAAGLHLSPEGQQQAEGVAARLAMLEKVAAVYTSPLERTRETAAAIGRAVGCRPKTDAGLLECDFGAWTGRRLGDLRRRSDWVHVQRTPSAWRFPDGESFTEMQVRMVSALDALARRHPRDAIVVVSHADPIKAAVAHAMGAHLDHFQRIVVSPCSVSALLLGHGAPLALCVNEVGGDLRRLRPS